MNSQDAHILVDMLGVFRDEKSNLEKEIKKAQDTLQGYMEQRGVNELSGLFYRGLIIPGKNIVWNTGAIERLADRTDTRMSRLRTINEYSYIRNYMLKDAKVDKKTLVEELFPDGQLHV